MNKLILAGLSSILLVGATVTASAKDKDKHKHDDHRHHYDHRPPVVVVDPTRVIWVIEGGRPVKRVVYLDSHGRYYRKSYGNRVYVSQRYYTSYPSKYFYSDGRRRPGITIRF